MGEYGRQAFEELLQPKREQRSVLDDVLSARAPGDPALWKIASDLDPTDPVAVYVKLGGGFGIGSVKLSATTEPAKHGGLKAGVKLFPHQQEAVNKILAKDGSLLLSHPVGSGKTLTSIAAFETMRDRGMANRALVVTPASLRTNYLENGIKRFTSSKGAVFGNVQEVSAGTHVSSETPDPNAQYHIVGYELFRNDPKKYIEAAGADTVIYDELHKMKNEGVLTTKAIKDARKYHRNFIGMTGSIVSNTPADIVPLVDAMTDGKHMLGNKTTFEARFVETKDTGEKQLRHPSVLRALLNPYVHHVDSRELQTSAPKKRVEEIQVEMSPYQRDLYKFIKKELDPLTELRLKMGASKINNAQLNDMFSKLLRLRQVSNSIHTMDKKVTPEQSAVQTPKMKRILDDVEEHLKETPDAQVVIHTNMIQGGVDVLTAGLNSRGVSHALFIGKGNPGVTEKSRQYGVDEYRQGKKKVIVLSAAGGEGLDLPNTTFVAMADGHFNPEKIDQAEARGIRAGGLSHRALGERQVLVRRYLSVMPERSLTRVAEIGKGIVSNLNAKDIIERVRAGGPVFINPFAKEKSTDQWIYGVAKAKAGLNKDLRESLKQSSVELPAFETHEDFEAWMLDGLEKAAASPILQALTGPAAGAAVGGLLGAAMGGTPPRSAQETRQDPNASLRNRLSSTLGGIAGGALGGYMNGVSEGPWMSILPAMTGAATGRAIGDLAAPTRSVPTSVSELLGKRQNYSDRALFETYWNRFGKELEGGGLETKLTDPQLEARFVGALKDLYEAGKTTDRTAREMSEKGRAQTKLNYILTGLLTAPVVGIGTAAPSLLKPLRPGENISVPRMAAGALPGAASVIAPLLVGYRKRYIDPGVSVESKATARARSEFSDEQLRDLLRGKAVEELKMKQHVIK